jgi:magnesium transporter
MVKNFNLTNGGVTDAGGPGRVLVFVEPDEGERKRLIEEFKVDEHTLRSALDPDELGRVEFEEEHCAIIFKRPKRYTAEDNFLFKVLSGGLFLWPDKLVLVVNDDAGLFDGRTFSRVAALQSLALRILFSTIVHFEQHLRAMNMISDELEGEINKSMENRHLLHMFTLEKGLVYYINAVSSNGRVLEKLRNNAARLKLSEGDLEYIEDLVIENTQCLEQATTYSQVISSLMDARASVVNNNLSVMMKNLNAIVIAVAIPSFISSVFSMSEFSVLVGGVPLGLAYPLFATAMVAVGVGTFFLIRRMERLWK